MGNRTKFARKIGKINKTNIPKAIIAGSLILSGSTQALTFDELQGLTYLQVKEESQLKGGEPDFVDTKLVTRLTYTLDDMSGKMKVGSDGSVSFIEEDGIDYAPTTVQLPGGERVAFLFTVKQLNTSGSLDSFGGEFNVPSYRGSSFLDPMPRGGSTGYDTAVALPARGDDE